MATSDAPPSPSRQLLEVDDGYDDDWRQVEDDELPSLISSIEHGKYLTDAFKIFIANIPDPHPETQEYVDVTVLAEADEEVLNGIVSGRSGQSSQQGSQHGSQHASQHDSQHGSQHDSQHASQQASQKEPPKVLNRPVSSGKDPAAGFSFSKAKPVQQLDFRRPKQAPVMTQPPERTRPSESFTPEAYSHQSSHLHDTTQVVQNVVDVAADRVPSPKHPNPSTLKDALPVPFPDIISTRSQAYRNPTSNTIAGPMMHGILSTSTMPNEVSTAADDTVIDSNPIGTKEPPLLNIVIPDHNESKRTTTASADRPAEVARVSNEPQVNKPKRPQKASKDPLTSIAGAPKITKTRRRKTQVVPATNGLPPPSNPKSTYTEDDLLRLLMYRRRQGQQELEYFKITQNQNEDEILRLREMSNNLSNELQEVLQRETQKAAELSRIKAKKPIWESKIKRLSDYVKGLTNDHKRLREDADIFQKQRTDIFVAGKDLHDTLEAAQKSVEQERIRSQRLKDDAHHRIETLEQTVQHQCTQLRSDENLLKAERERCTRLEDQISRVSISHEQLLQLFTGHRDTITGKIDNLLHHAKSIVLPNLTSESHHQDPVRPMLEQCISMLQKLHEADTVKPEDFKKLGDTMDSFVRGYVYSSANPDLSHLYSLEARITLSVETCEENYTSIESGQKQLALALQDQLRALDCNISSEHALAEQISDLREVRATIRERLQATESSLTDARREIVALRLKDQEQSRRVVELETDVAQAQSRSAEVPHAMLRIQELDSRNKDLQSEVVTLSKDAAVLSDQLQQRSTEAQDLTERLAVAQERFQAATEKTARLREEKSASERTATFEREQLRNELSKAASMQLASVESEHMNVIQQLKLEKLPVEEKLQSVTKQNDLLRAEKEKGKEEIRQLQALLKEARNNTEAVIGTRKALQLHLNEMEVRMHDKNLQCGETQVMLKKVNDQIKAKDLEIAALQASQITRIGSSRVPDRNNLVRSAGGGHALHQRPQQAFIDQNPSGRPTSSKSSRHFTKRLSVVEDSQPTEKPSFVSLDDLMLEDPFADYAQDGPHTIAGEDISHLFPSTPGTGSQPKDVDLTRKSVFHTTVVSETQRTQHQLIREPTPHTSNHALIKAHSQSQPQPRAHFEDRQSNAVPRSSIGTSTTKANTSRRDSNNPSSIREASITRDSTQPQGSVKDPRQGKRNSLAAGFDDMNPQARPSKVYKAGPAKPTRALGPVVEDSQSPVLNGRSRKMTRRKSSAPKGETLFQRS